MPENDGGWGNWSTAKVNEVDDVTWLANPKEAVRTVIERAGREVTNYTAAVALQHAAGLSAAAASAQSLNDAFARSYPDLMRTDVERTAVQLALGKVAGDRRFHDLMQTRRDAAFEIVAKLANHELGRDGRTEGPAPRRERASARSDDPWDASERDAEAMGEVISHVFSTNRGTGG